MSFPIVAGTVLAFLALAEARDHWTFQGAPTAPLPVYSVASGRDALLWGTPGGIYFQKEGDSGSAHVDSVEQFPCQSWASLGEERIAACHTRYGDTTILRRSRDGGATWSTFLSEGISNRHVVLMNHGSDLLAYFRGNRHDSKFPNALFRYDPVSGAWSRQGVIPWGRVVAFASLGADLYAASSDSGVYRTSDLGATWSPDLRNAPYRGIHALAPTPDGLLMATGTELLRLDTAGPTWSKVTGGLPAGPVNAVSPCGDALLAGTGRGLYRSLDGGGSWHPAPGHGPDSIVRLFELGRGVSVVESWPDRFTLTRDQGRSWRVLRAPHRRAQVQGLAAEGGLLVARASEYWEAAPRFSRVALSKDKGQTWNHGPDSVNVVAFGNGLIKAMQIDVGCWIRAANGEWSLLPNPPEFRIQRVTAARGSLFATTLQGLLRLSDPDSGWIPTRGVTAASTGFQIFPSGGILFFHDHNSLFRSLDGGASWAPTGLSINNPRNFIGTGSVHLLFDYQEKVYRSSDNGVTWNLTQDSLDRWVSSVVRVAAGNRLLVGDGAGNVQVSEDSGRTWIAHRVSPSGGSITWLGADGGDLFALSWQEGIYLQGSGVLRLENPGRRLRRQAARMGTFHRIDGRRVGKSIPHTTVSR